MLYATKRVSLTGQFSFSEDFMAVDPRKFLQLCHQPALGALGDAMMSNSAMKLISHLSSPGRELWRHSKWTIGKEMD